MFPVVHGSPEAVRVCIHMQSMMHSMIHSMVGKRRRERETETAGTRGRGCAHLHAPHSLSQTHDVFMKKQGKFGRKESERLSERVVVTIVRLWISMRERETGFSQSLESAVCPQEASTR